MTSNHVVTGTDGNQILVFILSIQIEFVKLVSCFTMVLLSIFRGNKVYALYLLIESFNTYKARGNCPVDCIQRYYKYQITDSRFLHNPPTGVEPKLLRNENRKKRVNSSHLLELAESLSSQELGHYAE